MTLNTIGIDISTEKFNENGMVCDPELKYLDHASVNTCGNISRGDLIHETF